MNTPPAEIAETHVSWVLMLGDRAFKLKKPVRNGFVDFSTVQARQQACEDEVRINRRLASDVYLGVDTLSDASGRIIDYLVEMRRMPAERRLSTLVSSGSDVDDAVRLVAHRLAALHLALGRSPAADEAASTQGTLARWEANAAEMAPLSRLLAEPALGAAVLDRARTYIGGRSRLFDSRVRAGRASDGHGDLSADDIFVLDDGPRILDALEFDERLRLGDGLADIAFLAMHLEHLGAGQLADRLLGWYGEFAADHWPASLAHHHIAYRAQVRAKVALLRAAQARHTTAPEADQLLALAERHLDAGRVSLVLVGGAPGTGKSTLAGGLVEQSGWVLLRSDETRKELAGLAAHYRASAPLEAGIYEPSMTALTYGELLHRAETLLEMGESVVLDATWADPSWRAAANRLAERAKAELVAIRCVAPTSITQARVRQRLTSGKDPSDATEEVARVLAEQFAPWPEAIETDTSGDQQAALAQAKRGLSEARLVTAG